MKEEDHAYLFSRGKSGRLKDIQFAVLTYGDWTYAQKPMNLKERFAGLRLRNRADGKTLDVLETLGQTFESDLQHVFGESIIHEMMELKPYKWEEKIKKRMLQAQDCQFQFCLILCEYGWWTEGRMK